MNEPSFLNPRLMHAVVEDNMPGECMAVCPSIAELDPGRFLVAYHRTSETDFHGRYGVWTRESSDGAITWGPARMVADNVQSPGLLRLADGTLLMNACEHHGDSQGTRSTTMRLFRSADEGITWQEEAPIWAKSPGMYLQGGCGSLVRLNSGRILCPIHGAAGGDNYHSSFKAWCFYSDDGGRRWQESAGRVSLPKRGAMEPSVAQFSDGSLLMALRTQLGSVWLAESRDDGKTWSEPRSSGIEAPEAPLAMAVCEPEESGDGRRSGPADDSGTWRAELLRRRLLVMVYCGGRYEPEHHHCGERTPLRLAVSDDGGWTWRQVVDIAGGNHEFGASGPNSICLASDGRVVIAYNWISTPWSRDLSSAGGIRIATVSPQLLKREDSR